MESERKPRGDLPCQSFGRRYLLRTGATERIEARKRRAPEGEGSSARKSSSGGNGHSRQASRGCWADAQYPPLGRRASIVRFRLRRKGECFPCNPGRGGLASRVCFLHLAERRARQSSWASKSLPSESQILSSGQLQFSLHIIELDINFPVWSN